MNQILEANGISERELRQLDAGVAKPARRGSFAWRSYLRCLFLMAIMAAVGYLAWRPAMFRFSLLMTTVAPSRGDSLAWKPESADATPKAPTRRLSAPPEWRLAAKHGIGWKMSRPYADNALNWHDDTFPLPDWPRTSDNSWTWQDDFDAWRKHDLELAEIPPQQAASDYRAKDTERWGSIQTAAADTPETRPAPVALASETAVKPASPRIVPSVEPLTTAGLAATSTPTPPPPTGEVAAGSAAAGSLADSEYPPAASRDHDPLAALRLPSRNVPERRTAPPVQEIPAEAAVTLPESLPTGSSPMAGVTNVPGPSAPVSMSAPSEPVTNLAMRLAEAPSAMPTTATEPAPTARLNPTVMPSTPAPTRPDIAERQPAALQPSPEAVTAVVSAGPSSRVEEPGGDWKNREIVGAISGAYLTIYPKLKFIGLCVPGQGYIRKYNQVTVPADLLSPKMHARDGRTPYGKYFIAGRERTNQGSRLLLSWPSPEDARRIGLDAGTVSTIENAWLDQILPPQNTAAGGGVMLSTVRPGQSQAENGFALEEPNMEEIFVALPDGAWVFVQP